MKLRHLIERRGPGRSDPAPPASVAKIAKVEGEQGASFATIATFATPPGPERWPNVLRSLTVAGVDLRAAADALERLAEAGTVAEALALGWDARDLVGLWRFPPHALPSRAGLIYSLYPGDTVRSVRSTGCVIVIGGANLRHIWLRASVRDVVPPWKFAASPSAGPEIRPPDAPQLPVGMMDASPPADRVQRPRLATQRTEQR